MSSNANEDSGSPDPGLEDSSIMADNKSDNASGDEHSPANSNDKPTETQPGTKSNAKDPSRPRRKKARRACYACQRAHLTCGDERPCLRCVKRGLSEQCHDGVRKKAKYLHDAPPEALNPGFAGNYHSNGPQQHTNVPTTSDGMQTSPTGDFFSPGNNSAPYPRYSQVVPAGQMGPPMMEQPNNDGMDPVFNPQRNSDTPQYQSASSTQVSPAQGLNTTLDTANPLVNTTGGSFDSSFFDPNDTSLYNFNISDLNFENRYGALEFGMLGHMSGAVGTPDLEAINPLSASGLAYDGSHSIGSYGYGQQGFPSWQTVPNSGSRHGSSATVWNNQADAFAINEHAMAGHSPHSQGYSRSPESQFVQPDPGNQQELLRQSISHQQQQRQQSSFPLGTQSDPSRKRRRPTSEIYSSVRSPYSYTQGFHAMTAFLQKRYPPKKVLRIAKALATIRPSFISCNKNLNHDDLVFTEQAFQRTLVEFEDYINHVSTPTIIIRRTGEIAFASKEFSLVTGWRRDVLLGREPNLNVNTGSSGERESGTQTGSSTRGAATPRMAHLETDPARPQSVFIAEIMDEDSVVEFYEDFADGAFGSTQTYIIGKPCSLLKYKTKDDAGWAANDQLPGGGPRNQQSNNAGNDQPLIRGEAGMNALGERDGRVQCMMCWSVRRDCFDIPMMIVMNFLPII